MKINKLIYSLVILASLVSCSGFLAERSQDETDAQTVGHFEALMLGEFTSDYAFFKSVNHMTDNMTEVATANQSLKTLKTTYTWQQEIEIDENGETVRLINTAWGEIYEDIAIMNYILHSRNTMIGDADEINYVIGEAYFARALSYFNLVNLYGVPFNEETKNTDLGVPIRDGIDTQQAYDRKTVAECYAHIELDMDSAMTCIERSGIVKSKWHPSLAACYLLMSRIKLFQKQWDETIKYADLAMSKGKLSDLKNISGTTFIYEENPELLYAWQKVASGIVRPPTGGSAALPYCTSESLLSCYEKGDLRADIFFTSFTYNGNTYIISRKGVAGAPGTTSAYSTIGFQNMRISEAYLNKAEALVHKSDATSAISLVQALHAKRFSNTSSLVYPSEQDEVLEYVMNERRREFCFEDHARWFDLRRMEKQPTIQHKYSMYDASGVLYKEELYILKPNDLNYTLPLPIKERENNQNIINNEREDKISIN